MYDKRKNSLLLPEKFISSSSISSHFSHNAVTASRFNIIHFQIKSWTAAYLYHSASAQRWIFSFFLFNSTFDSEILHMQRRSFSFHSQLSNTTLHLFIYLFFSIAAQMLPKVISRNCKHFQKLSETVYRHTHRRFVHVLMKCSAMPLDILSRTITVTQKLHWFYTLSHSKTLYSPVFVSRMSVYKLWEHEHRNRNVLLMYTWISHFALKIPPSVQ